MYILRPHAAGISYAPPFYTPPTPRRVFSGVGGWACIKFGPVKFLDPPYPVLHFLGFWIFIKENLKITKDFLSLPNPQTPWERQRKDQNNQGSSSGRIYQGNLKKQGKEGLGSFRADSIYCVIVAQRSGNLLGSKIPATESSWWTCSQAFCCPCPPSSRGPQNPENSSRSKVGPKVGFGGP